MRMHARVCGASHLFRCRYDIRVGAGRVFKRQEADFRYYITVAGPAITIPPSNADPPPKLLAICLTRPFQSLIDL
jgi:hypothetical protein